jgi:dTDP-4-amino-4,6-dideoxygalactose transaminase
MPARLKELSLLRLPLIEDASQAHGSDAAWGRCGSFGLAAAFSFYPTKNLGGYGDGGMIVTSDRNIAELGHMIRNYGSAKTILPRSSETTAVWMNFRLRFCGSS